MRAEGQVSTITKAFLNIETGTFCQSQPLLMAENSFLFFIQQKEF
jgi:hypothetical protein